MSRSSYGSRAALGAVVALLWLTGCGSLKRCAYQGFDRDDWQQPARVVADLALAKGAKIADLGAGGGYFTFPLAEAVGPEGRVYAVDIDEGMNAFVLREAEDRGLDNVRAVLAEEADPRLPEPVDLVFTSNTYHHLDDRTAYFRNVRERYLATGGRVAIVEFRPNVTSHATEREAIEAEMTAAGFRLVKSFDYLERQHFLVFSVDGPASSEPAR